MYYAASSSPRIRILTTTETTDPHTHANTQRTKEDDTLMQAFRRLNSYLEGLYDVHTLDCVAYLLPFQQVIVSEHASGALTSAALSALSKFALYGFLSRDLPRAREGIEMVGDCIRYTHIHTHLYMHTYERTDTHRCAHTRTYAPDRHCDTPRLHSRLVLFPTTHSHSHHNILIEYTKNTH